MCTFVIHHIFSSKLLSYLKLFIPYWLLSTIPTDPGVSIGASSNATPAAVSFSLISLEMQADPWSTDKKAGGPIYVEVHSLEIHFQILLVVWIFKNQASVQRVASSTKCKTGFESMNIVYITTLWLKERSSVPTVNVKLRDSVAFILQML